MAKVPRHEFVPVEVQPYAYLNRPIPIGFDKTISQPLMVVVMTDLLELKPDDAVLEIGTGLGYQAAVLAELAGRVYSVEIIDELAQRAIQRPKRQGYTNVEVHVGNGYAGWPKHAPFDKVIVTAAPDLIPPPLINQLRAGGRMVIPVGLPGAQQLVVVEKDLNGRVTTKKIMPVLFSGTRGIRPACIPGVLIEMITDVFRRELQSFSGNIYEAQREAKSPANALELLRMWRPSWTFPPNALGQCVSPMRFVSMRSNAEDAIAVSAGDVTRREGW